MRNKIFIIIALLLLGFELDGQSELPVYQDVPYLQDYAIKFYFEKNITKPQKAYTDRNGVIKILTEGGIYIPINGHLQYPGKLKLDKTYIPMPDKNIQEMVIYNDQFVYANKKAIFSNAWAGKLYSKHHLPEIKMICGGSNFEFMVSNGRELSLIKDSQQLWKAKLDNEEIVQIKYNKFSNQFLILGKNSIYSFSSRQNNLNNIFSGSNFTCLEVSNNGKIIFVGTNNGYFSIDDKGKHSSKINTKLPATEITSIKEIDGKLWFGTNEGAFMARENGHYNYYYGERWLPGNIVKSIEDGPDQSILVLTNKGLGQICFKDMTLNDKAMKFEKDVRQRKIRYGMATDKSSLENHDLSTAQNRPADSDNLWTSMYLGSQLFRYLATDSEEAKQNCYEAFEILERFHTINNIKGLFGRSIERTGYMKFNKSYRAYVEDFWYDGYQNTVSWQHSDEEDWDWKAHASSDQTVGQIFAMTLIAEYIKDDSWRNRAITILDDLMTYIVNNNLCLIDINGKPTLWGRWNPEYLNRLPKMVGDRKVYSSNIIAFLQSAYKFTGKDLFKNKAFELMNENGYLENLMRPFTQIGKAPNDADNWSKMLS